MSHLACTSWKIARRGGDGSSPMHPYAPTCPGQQAVGHAAAWRGLAQRVSGRGPAVRKAMSDIYLVDDHKLMRHGLRALLEGAGHRVVGEAAAPAPALADIERLRPDVLLLDLGLGSHTGFELLAELQRRQLPTRTVVVSMSEQPHHVAEALRLGALGYVLKDAASVELLLAVERVVRGQRYLVGAVAELVKQARLTPSAEAELLDSLSMRERQVLLYVVRGLSSAGIGERLHLSSKTIDSYRSRMMSKLGVGDVPALVRLAIRNGLIDASER